MEESSKAVEERADNVGSTPETWSISHQSVTNQTLFALITGQLNIATTVKSTSETPSSSPLPIFIDMPWGSSIPVSPSKKAEAGPSWGIPSIWTARDMTVTRRTVWMPKKYQSTPLTLPKGWVFAEGEVVIKGMIEEVWALQKEALLNSTTPGR